MSTSVSADAQQLLLKHRTSVGNPMGDIHTSQRLELQALTAAEHVTKSLLFV